MCHVSRNSIEYMSNRNIPPFHIFQFSFTAIPNFVLIAWCRFPLFMAYLLKFFTVLPGSAPNVTGPFLSVKISSMSGCTANMSVSR